MNTHSVWILCLCVCVCVCVCCTYVVFYTQHISHFSESHLSVGIQYVMHITSFHTCVGVVCTKCGCGLVN